MENRYKYRVFNKYTKEFEYSFVGAVNTQPFSDITRYEKPQICIGSYDKNDNLIYEGDIVNQQHWNKNMVIKFVYGYGECCGFMEEDAITHSNCTGKNCTRLNPRYATKYEIVGNIYQNIELVGE